MKPVLFGIAILMMGACVLEGDDVAIGTSPNPRPAPNCEADQYQSLIGQNIQRVKLKPDRSLRILTHDGLATTDYRTERTNVSVGKNGTIEKVFCG